MEEIEDYISLIDGDNRDHCLSMLSFFREKYPLARGSSHNHQNWDGGYYDHVFDIMRYADILYGSLGKLPFSISDVMLVLFLHDIEKPVKYSDGFDGRSDNQIRASLIVEFGIELNDDHLNALKYIHGEGNDYRKDHRVMGPLCAFCHCCDIIGSRIFYE